MPAPQSVCLPMLKPGDLPLGPFLAGIAEIGFEAVEIWARDDGFAELVTLTRRAGLRLASMCGHDGIARGLNDRAQHDRIEAELRTSIDAAVDAECAGLICFSGNRCAGQSEDDAIAAIAEGLQRVAPYAEARGVTLNLELLNSRIDHPGYQADRTAFGVAVCERVASPRVRLLYDIYHMQIMEGDVIRTIERNIGWIGHFHTAGVPGRHDPDDTQELNYPAICSAIAATAYTGYLGHEFRPRGDALAALKDARRRCGGAPAGGSDRAE